MKVRLNAFSLQTYQKTCSRYEYIRTLGFERSMGKPGLVRDTLEQDMMEHHSDGKFEDKVFVHYPLLGSKILKQETLNKLNENTRKYIDTVLRDPLTKMTLRAEMQITLALVNNAKSWKSEENSNCSGILFHCNSGCSADLWRNVLDRIHPELLPFAINFVKFYGSDERYADILPQYEGLLRLVCCGIVKYAKDECNRGEEALEKINFILRTKHLNEYTYADLLSDFVE